MSDANAALEQALREYQPEIAKRGKCLIAALRKRLPGANLLVYDSYNALAVGFSSTNEQSGIVVSVTLYPRWVSLFFPRGAALTDPACILKGSGKTFRHVVVEDVSQIDRSEFTSLFEEALNLASPPIRSNERGQVVLKSVSVKKRPRRP